MSVTKKRDPKKDTVHGVTDKGVEIAPGVFIPAPPVPAKSLEAFLLPGRANRMWGWACLVPGCERSRVKPLWDENMARTSYLRHRERKHP